jgi:ornithine decarboxylase
MPTVADTVVLTPDLKDQFLNPHISEQSQEGIKPTFNKPVIQVIREKLESMNEERWESDEENSFFVADLGEVQRQHLTWKALLPRIEPFYGKFPAVKKSDECKHANIP